jgi:hypothetical protein
MARVAYTGGNAWILSEVWGSELGMREWLESTILPAVWATVHGRSDEEPTGRPAGTSDTRARPTDRQVLPRRVGTAQWRVNLPAGSRRMPRRGKR